MRRGTKESAFKRTGSSNKNHRRYLKGKVQCERCYQVLIHLFMVGKDRLFFSYDFPIHEGDHQPSDISTDKVRGRAVSFSQSVANGICLWLPFILENRTRQANLTFATVVVIAVCLSVQNVPS